MRYSSEQKAETRQAILDAAAQLFRSGGFSGVGVDAVAARANVTSGAFYKHFSSKLDAFHAVVTAGVDRVFRRVSNTQEDERLNRADPVEWIEEVIGAYMSGAHRRSMAAGCALPTLTADVARSAPQVKESFEKGIVEAANRMASHPPFAGKDDGFDRAVAVLALLAGGTAIARAVKKSSTGDRIAEAVRRAASQLAHGDLSDAKPARAVAWKPSN